MVSIYRDWVSYRVSVGLVVMVSIYRDWVSYRVSVGLVVMCLYTVTG